MRKITNIIILGLLVGGCSVFRNNERTISEITNKVIDGNILESTGNQNITNNGFFVQKAEIEVNSLAGNDKFIANIKFEKPDKYLISLRSRTGIEGARIFISGDSIQMNDRINKKLYLGTSSYLVKKYGFSQSFLPLIFGDIILEKRCKTGQEKCVDERLTVDCQLKGIPLSYIIDCKRKKVMTVDQINGIDRDGLSIRFEKYFISGNIIIPRIIELNDINYGISLRIKILKVESPWNGNISFIPGKGYELIELQ